MKASASLRKDCPYFIASFLICAIVSGVGYDLWLYFLIFWAGWITSKVT